MALSIGQKVVFIKDAPAKRKKAWKKVGGKYPTVGQTYTVESVNEWPHRKLTLITLEEINNNAVRDAIGSECVPGFPDWAFKPADEAAVD